MSAFKMLLKCLCVVLHFVSFAQCANILAVAPCPSYSHQIAYLGLWKELSLRGHTVTLITTDPLHDARLTGLTEIDVKWTYKYVTNVSQMAENKLTMWTFHAGILELMKEVSDAHLSHPQVQDLLQNTKKFDVILVEFLAPEWLALSEVYNCPKILFASMEVTASYYHLTGNPAHPILHPEFVSPFHGQLSFRERVMSTLLSWYYKWFFAFRVFPERQKIMNKYFKTNSTISQLISDVDLMILSISPLIQGPRPLGPNIVSIAGYRKDIFTGRLDLDLGNFLDKAREGCIYVSLGSNVKSSELSDRLLKPITEALAQVPYKVLWKFEGNDTANLPKNVKAVKWLPQQKVLMHANVKLFLCQGGLQSMEEAIYGEVPFVIIPFFSDQFQNARILKDKGLAVVLDKKTLTSEELKNAIVTVMTDPKYRKGMKKLKNLILDEPMTGLEKAVWWTEYVIRNKGAKHLKSPVIGMPFYQYYLLDVIGFFLLAIILVTTFVVYAAKKLWKIASYEKQKIN